MDVRSYKLAAPTAVTWPGRDAVVELRALSQRTIDEVELRAHARCSARSVAGGEAEAIEQMAGLVGASLGVTADDVKGAADSFELSFLYRQWQQVQQRSEPDVMRLEQWLRKSVNDIPEVLLDGMAAYHAAGPAEYYGTPTADLTGGQVLWFLLLKAAYMEFHVPNDRGRTKQPTRQWLEKDHAERMEFEV